MNIRKATQKDIDAWSAINNCSYFVFTTDRLIIITFYSHFAGIDLIANTLAGGTFERTIHNVYTCSLPDKSQVQHGAIMKHVTGAFIWTVILIVA